MAENTGKILSEKNIGTMAIIVGAGLATLIVIMYFKKCYVVIKNKRYGFNPNPNIKQTQSTNQSLQTT
ncbi:MAG: hypothetical protein KGL95_01755 [Patescibacteria group bacterium]|nr:hypothetical protein [Patescibacteria group bacterium]